MLDSGRAVFCHAHLMPHVALLNAVNERMDLVWRTLAFTESSAAENSWCRSEQLTDLFLEISTATKAKSHQPGGKWCVTEALTLSHLRAIVNKAQIGKKQSILWVTEWSVVVKHTHTHTNNMLCTMCNSLKWMTVIYLRFPLDQTSIQELKVHVIFFTSWLRWAICSRASQTDRHTCDAHIYGQPWHKLI